MAEAGDRTDEDTVTGDDTADTGMAAGEINPGDPQDATELELGADALDTDAADTDAPVTDTTDTHAVDTDTADTDAADFQSKAEGKAETRVESGTEEEADRRTRGEERKADRTRKRKRREFRMDRCMEERWTCEGMPLWKIYARTFAEREERLKREDKFKRRKPARLARLPRVASEEETSACKCIAPNAFHLEKGAELPNKLDRRKLLRIWKSMRSVPAIGSGESVPGSEASEAGSGKWPGVWPCVKRELMKEIMEERKRRRRKRRDVFPCDPQEEDGSLIGLEGNEEFAERRELGHARIPGTCPEPGKDLLVDRAAGERPGLVDGDYVIFELPSRTKGDRVYADVCLRGLKGMHLPELGPLRARRKTWKFCFYQAVVVLLAKTQLRYKYAWSANIDYIYDHAWMLFAHIGTINVKQRQRLDDIVVYNYKYSVELELVQETSDVPIVRDASWDYEERNLRRKETVPRRELAEMRLEIGTEKITDGQSSTPVHKDLRQLEKWFDKLPVRYRNCVFRTTRFSVAFWKDGLFWYLYNPYRCDEFGYWCDTGYACIMKFCTKDSLRRHLMILLLRAYVYKLPKPPTTDDVLGEEAGRIPGNGQTQNHDTEPTEESYYTIQIFNMIYHCCQIHNLKLLERSAAKPRRRPARKKTLDDCPFDPLDFRDPCAIEREESDIKDAIEKPTWLKLMQVTWTKCSPQSQKKRSTSKEGSQVGKMRWHQYVVEESNKLFSLWGEVHITNGMFEKENRGMQTYACYVVCAGMTRITAPEYWTSKTLDVIVMCGDRYYTESKLEAEYKSGKREYGHVGSWSKYLASHFRIGETLFQATVLPAIRGRLYSRSGGHLWRSLEQMFLDHQFGILTCESSCLGVFKFCGAYYVCDVNSFGPPVFQYGEGSVYLMRATYFYKFLTTLVLTIGSPECSQFALNPIRILKAVDIGPASFPGGSPDGRDGRRRPKADCPYDEARKKQMKRWKHKRAEAARTIDKMCCKGND